MHINCIILLMFILHDESSLVPINVHLKDCHEESCNTECECYNDADCDPQVGECNCKAGYIGNHCEKPCDEDFWGPDCKSLCNHGEHRCNPVNGERLEKCKAGRTGDNCEELCDDDFWGSGCKNVCNHGGHRCNPKNGERLIECKVGHTGDDCEKPCSEYFWGAGCQSLCNHGEHRCNPKTGERLPECKAGRSGDDCQELCGEDFWGPGCKNLCNHGGHRCNPQNGDRLVECKAGRGGNDCKETCGENFWGPGCRNICYCGGHTCDPITGKCLPGCKSGFFGKSCVECECNNLGTRKCLRDSGHCVCHVDWEGDMCNKCQFTKFGTSCNNTCACEKEHYNNCDQITGKCNCKLGWNGETCGECVCVNGKCNDLTGECNCHSGWRGIKCDQQCPPGWYGDECNNTCKCFQCRFTDGFCFDILNQKYCPLEFFNMTLNQCVSGKKLLRVEQNLVSDNNNPIIVISVSVACIGLILIIPIACVIVCLRKVKVEGRIEENAKNGNGSSSSESRPITPPCEVTSEGDVTVPEPSHNHLLHVPVETGYLEPKSLAATPHIQATDTNQAISIPLKKWGWKTSTRQRQEFDSQIPLLDLKLSTDEHVQIRTSVNLASSVIQSFISKISKWQAKPKCTPPPEKIHS